MIARRNLLKWLAAGVGTPAWPALGADAQAPVPPQPADPAQSAKPFDFNQVVEYARALAKKPYEPPSTPLPGPFDSLSYDQYVGIRSKPGTAVWSSDNVGFAIEPLHRGKVFSTPVIINIVENGAARRLDYKAAQFDFGKLQVPDKLSDLEFSGFRVLHARSGMGLVDTAIFQGASFFRTIANNQLYGLTARALSIRTADTNKGEEFPLFREFWIERPSPASDMLVINALVDSDSMTGAYRFTLRPGDVTIIDTECTLFSRSAADFYGLGCTAAMFLFGPIARRDRDDIREAVSEVSGLQVLNSNGEWLWRPLSNPQALQISVFSDPNPRGFGLLQRQRDFNRFQDDDQHWELRPSLWIEPISEWGEGSVSLVEIPSDSEVNDNVICFWRPSAVLQPGAEASFTYRQFWCWTPPDRPDLATVTTTRGGRGPANRQRKFLVEFSHETFANPQYTADLKANLSTSVGTVAAMSTFASRERRTFRVLFTVDFGGEQLSELRLVLERAGKPASETWLYRWTA